MMFWSVCIRLSKPKHLRLGFHLQNLQGSLLTIRSLVHLFQIHHLLFWVVLATGPGNPPAVRVWTGKTVRFGSRTIQTPDLLLLGGRDRAPYPSTRGFCRVQLDPSGPISGSAFRVFLFMVTFRYATVDCKILTMVLHCHFLMY